MAAKRRKRKADDENPDLGKIMQETAENDAAEVKLGAAAKHVKQCHLLTQEAHRLLQAARSETASTQIIDAELARVMVLAGEIHEEADEARRGLSL